MLATVKGLAALLAETRQALLSHRLALFLYLSSGHRPIRRGDRRPGSRSFPPDLSPASSLIDTCDRVFGPVPHGPVMHPSLSPRLRPSPLPCLGAVSAALSPWGYVAAARVPPTGAYPVPSAGRRPPAHRPVSSACTCSHLPVRGAHAPARQSPYKRRATWDQTRQPTRPAHPRPHPLDRSSQGGTR